MRLARAAEIVENGIDETLSYYSMPPGHWRCLRTNNPLERLMREIRRRTRVVGAFPDGKSALMYSSLWNHSGTGMLNCFPRHGPKRQELSHRQSRHDGQSYCVHSREIILSGGVIIIVWHP